MKIQNILFCFFISISLSFSQWEKANTGIEKTRPRSICKFNNSLFATYGGIYKSDDNGMTWNTVLEYSNNRLVKSIISKGCLLFAAADSLGIVISRDSGNTWTVSNEGITYNSFENMTTTDDAIYIATTRGEIFKSVDLGSTWSFVSQILSLARIESFNNDLYVVTYGDGVLISKDGAETWTPINEGLENLWMSTIDVLGATMYCTNGYNIIYKRTDYSGKWDMVYQSSEKTYFHALAHYKHNIFAGNGKGVLLSSDEGVTWNYINDGLVDSVISSILITDEYIFVGAGHIGVFRRRLSEVVSSVSEPEINEQLLLFPNPAENYFELNIPLEPCRYTITVTNSYGDVAASIADFHSGGELSRRVDVSGLASGVYFCRLNAGGRTYVEKFLVCK